MTRRSSSSHLTSSVNSGAEGRVAWVRTRAVGRGRGLGPEPRWGWSRWGETERLTLRAPRAECRTCAIAVVLEVALPSWGSIGIEARPCAVHRHHPEPMRQEVVKERRGVLVELDLVDGHGRHLGLHRAAQSVGHADVGLGQRESNRIVGQLVNHHRRRAHLACTTARMSVLRKAAGGGAPDSRRGRGGRSRTKGLPLRHADGAVRVPLGALPSSELCVSAGRAEAARGASLGGLAAPAQSETASRSCRRTPADPALGRSARSDGCGSEGAFSVTVKRYVSIIDSKPRSP